MDKVTNSASRVSRNVAPNNEIEPAGRKKEEEIYIETLPNWISFVAWLWLRTLRSGKQKREVGKWTIPHSSRAEWFCDSTSEGYSETDLKTTNRSASAGAISRSAFSDQYPSGLRAVHQDPTGATTTILHSRWRRVMCSNGDRDGDRDRYGRWN